MTQNYHTQRDYFVFFLKMKEQCVSKGAEIGLRREGSMTSGHINAEWRLNECAGMGGNSKSLGQRRAERKPMWGPNSKALQGPSMAKPEDATTSSQAYLTQSQAHSQAAGSRGGKTFSKELVSSIREPLHAK